MGSPLDVGGYEENKKIVEPLVMRG